MRLRKVEIANTSWSFVFFYLIWAFLLFKIREYNKEKQRKKKYQRMMMPHKTESLIKKNKKRFLVYSKIA